MKRFILSSHFLIVYCLVLALFAGMGYAGSQAAAADGTTVITQALKQADAVRNPANRVVALSLIAGTYLQKGYYNQALNTADKIAEPYARSLLLLELAHLNAKQGPSGQSTALVDKAMAVIDRIKNPAQKVYVWIKVAEVCNLIPGLKTTGLTALDLSSEKVEKIRDTQLRADRQTTLAEHNLAYGRELEALALLDAALEVSQKQKDAHKRITVLDHVAAGYLQAGKAEKASAVVADIEDLYARSAAYDRMVDYYASMGQLDKAAEKAAAIERPYTRAYTLSHLAVAQQEAGIPGAVDLLKRAWMAAEKVKDRFLKSSAMGQVAGSRAAIGQVDEALALTEQIADDVVQAATMKKIAAGFAKEGQYDRAAALADGIAHPYYQASTLNRLAEIARVGLGGDPAQAQQWLARAAQVSDKIEDVYQQHAVRVDTVNGLAALGQFDQAVKLAGLLEDRYHFATALYHVTHQYTLQKQYEEAMRMADAIDDPYYRASALTEIAGALFESGPVAFERDPDINTLAFAQKRSVLKRIEIETARGQVHQASVAMMNTAGSALIRYAVAEEDAGSFFPQSGMLIANRSFPKKKNVLKRGEDVEMKTAMDDVFKVLNTLVNVQEMDTPDKQQQFLVYLENVRYGRHHQRHFWANDLQGWLLESPYLPELEGKDLSDFQDANGNVPFLLFNRAGLKKGQGIVSHMWPKDELKNKSYPRISLVRIFEPWEWNVGTSFTPPTIEDYELYDNVILDGLPASPI